MTMGTTDAFVTALEEAASQEESGCLYVADENATRSGRVFFSDGKVYAVHVDGFMPKIGHRLRTGGMLTDDEYQRLLAEAGGNVYAPHLGASAVEQGLIEQTVLDAVLREILLSSVGAMTGWTRPSAKFKRNTTTDLFTIPAVSVAAILKAVAKRRDRWEELWNRVAADATPENTYPCVAESFHAAPETLSSEVAAILAASDGTLSLDEVAGECGLTRFETGHVLDHLKSEGWVVMNTQPSTTRPDMDLTVAESHGTAETAIAEGTDHDLVHDDTDSAADDLPDAAEQVEQEHPEVVAEVEAFTQEVVAAERAENLTDEPVVHFAPDVVETLTAAADDTDDTDDEASAFGGEADVLPDGMDLGSIPVEVITYDEDPAPTAEVPPLTGLADADLHLAPHPMPNDPHVAPVHAPAPLPVDLPHFAEPVPPVAAPEPAPAPDLPAAPPGVPVFVDASALDRVAGMSPAEIVAGMPGVPLPPLPGFSAPVPSAEPPVASTPVLAAPVAYAQEVQPDEQTDYEDGTDRHEDTVNVDPVPDAEPAPVEPAPVEPAPENLDPRIEATRQRLLDEINFAVEAAASAEAALARAQEDHDAHEQALTQHRETLDRYRTYLDEATGEQDRLEAEISSFDEHEAQAHEAEQRAVEQAASVEERATGATARVETARDALAAAQAELAAAEAELAQTYTAQEEAKQEVEAAQRNRTDLEQRKAVLASELVDVNERVQSYEAEIAEVEQMEHTFEGVRTNAAALKEAAEQRLASAQRNLATMQEKLTHLG